MSPYIVGIDPGNTGAIAVFGRSKDGYRLISCEDMPVEPRPVGKGSRIAGAELAQMMSLLRPEDTMVLLEYVNAAPMQGRKMGATSAFNFGEGFGIVQGVLSGNRYAYQMVTPRAWKQHFKLLGKDKDASRSLCKQLYPYRFCFARKKDGGRADAALIAQYFIDTGKGEQ